MDDAGQEEEQEHGGRFGEMAPRPGQAEQEEGNRQRRQKPGQGWGQPRTVATMDDAGGETYGRHRQGISGEGTAEVSQ